jgi:hypothetical protein
VHEEHSRSEASTSSGTMLRVEFLIVCLLWTEVVPMQIQSTQSKLGYM